MISWKNSIVIHAPTDRVFAYVDDPMNLVEWLPGMVEVADVIGSGAGQQQTWTYKMAACSFMDRLRSSSTSRENAQCIRPSA